MDGFGMSRTTATTWFLGAAALLALASCTKKEGEEIDLSAFQGADGPKLVAMAQDTQDADRRRVAIVKISEKKWGLNEPYLSWYANRLQIDRDPTVRCAAARALAKAVAVKYLPILVGALNDRSADVRWDAAVALEKVRGEAAIDPLRKAAAEDKSPDVRAAAAKALRYYPQTKVVRTLVYCLSDDSFEVRHWAHESLTAMMGKDLGVEPADWASATGGQVPLRGPEWKRPWWDWFGTTKPKEQGPPSAPSPATTTAPAEKPWWDWAGVTQKASPAPAPAPPSTPAPASAAAPAIRAVPAAAPATSPAPAGTTTRPAPTGTATLRAVPVSAPAK